MFLRHLCVRCYSTKPITKGRTPVKFDQLNFETKVPRNPEFKLRRLISKPDNILIDSKTLEILRRVSLVDVDNKQSLKTVSDAIAFADQILEVDTSQVEPLYSVLEDAQVELRPDEVTDGNIRADIIGNAVKTEEEYFVAPPGNIAIESKS